MNRLGMIRLLFLVVAAIQATCTHGLDLFGSLKKGLFSRQSVTEPQPMKVIGAGLGRTSTLSLYTALNSVGYKTHHMKEVFDNSQSQMWADAFSGRMSKLELVDRIADLGYTATTDFPGCLFYKEFLERNPTAKVILSVRDSPEKWVASVKATIGNSAMTFYNPMKRRPLKWVMPGMGEVMTGVWGDFGMGMSFDATGEMDADFAASAYTAWTETVKATVPPAQLLVHSAKQGWPPLCAFLDLHGDACPSNRGESYPRVNDKEEMKRTMAMIGTIAEYFDLVAGVVAGAVLMSLARCLFSGRSTSTKAKTH